MQPQCGMVFLVMWVGLVSLYVGRCCLLWKGLFQGPGLLLFHLAPLAKLLIAGMLTMSFCLKDNMVSHLYLPGTTWSSKVLLKSLSSHFGSTEI